ncbi:protein of unknown function UPF0075 [Alkaliphilus metalliredigens QYMF]|uniref:Anhydro-N-acetylmuramic acid kinase n=1 Tax=Alkaliphilus metalliredigens (strain QYMF) TaxID=293826 RepID=A6TVP6_ALKMQ|nr:anhydro-N-acetylmuramic acid kinase AnmK [Alkaliphilus metalliredigens]ABR50264.1 protein of unknown function UPF0075 [Alkaliphilus metalliredigens QYMF]
MRHIVKLLEKNKKNVIGLMSGTSIDGIDCALVEIEGHGLETKIKYKGFYNLKIQPQVKKRILRCCSIEESNVEQICQLNFEIGKLFGEAVLGLMKKLNMRLEEIDLIGSHGQTIYHVPQSSTLQIGEPSVIAEITGKPVIADFRVRDVAAGGHGAPLVAYPEYLLYRSDTKTRVFQNIGGIGNATVIPRRAKLEDVQAFDTGPGNMIIDQVVNVFTNGKLQYDQGGEIASKGKICQEVLNELMDHSYIKLLPPKTTGRESFGVNFTRNLLKRCKQLELSFEDTVSTVTAFTAKSIAYHYENLITLKQPIDEVIIAGGGSYNHTLINMIKESLRGVDVKIQEDIGYSSDAKEAIAFAILANEALHGNGNNIPSVTGAKKSVVMGKLIM